MSDPRSAPHLLITASAGTGKTTQLAWRYLRALLDERAAKPDRLLAVTFTRKAAGEIFERIIRQLLEASADKGKTWILSDRLALPDLTTERVGAALDAVLMQLHRVRVGTLDSFFAGIGKSFAPELDLPLGWAIVDEAREAELRAEAIAATFAGVDPAPTAELLSLAAGGRDRRGVARALGDFFANYGDLVDAAQVEAWGAGLGGTSPHDANEVAAAAAALRQAELPTTKAGKPSKNWLNAVERDLSRLDAGDWAGLLGSTLAQGAWRMLRFGEAFTYHSDEPSRHLAEAYATLVDHAVAIEMRDLAARAQRIRELVAPFAFRFGELKRRYAAYRFDDLPRRIAAAGGSLLPAELFFRLDSRIDHLLLDEFQDTSLLQWRALKPLVEEVAAGGAAGRSFFCVGDPKQSIYGWRGGVHELCSGAALKREIPALGDLAESRLEVNYRSAPEVLAWVDRVFARDDGAPTMLGEGGPAIAAWDAFTAPEVYPGHQPRKDAPAGYACLIEGPEVDGRGDDDADESDDDGAFGDPRLSTAARWIAEQARGPLAEREIGVLVRGNKALAQLVHELKALARQTAARSFEVSEEGGSPVLDGVAASVLVSLLRLADHPGDTAACFHVLQSGLGPHLRARFLRGGVGAAATWRGERNDAPDAPDVAAIASDVRAAAPRLSRVLRRTLATEGVGGLLAGAADAAGWLREGALTTRERQRVEQLLSVAFANDRAGGDLRLDGFIRAVEALRKDSPEPARVRVMTVHQAKGLAFDAVVLPELWPELVRASGARGPLVLRQGHSPFGEVLAVLPPVAKNLRPYLPAELQAAHAVQQQREYYEALCVLYVALTRARYATYALVFPRRPRERGTTFAALLRERLAPGNGGEQATDGWRVLAQLGDRDWAAAGPAGEAEPAPTPNVLPAPEPGFLARAAAPERRDHSAPSQLAHDELRAVDLLQLERAGMDYGTAIHACFERLGWVDEARPDAATIVAALTAAGVAPERREAMAADFAAMLDRPDVAAALSRAATRARGGGWAQAETLDVYAERGFALAYAGRTLSGAIDRLVIARAGDGRAVAAEVLDYKTDRIPDAAALDAAIERYRPQLEAYRAAAARIAGLDASFVGARLVFVGSGRVVDL